LLIKHFSRLAASASAIVYNQAMKINDSGMPEQAYWNSLFDIDAILTWMGCAGQNESVVEIGCGYGTFTAPVARVTTGTLLAFDIEQAMLDASRQNLDAERLSNVQLKLRDVLADETGLEGNSVDRVMLFNILHFDDRRSLLAEAARILRPGGRVDILHWRKDKPTPRGPEVESRPDTRIIASSIAGLPLQLESEGKILEPYHWGIQLKKQPYPPLPSN